MDADERFFVCFLFLMLLAQECLTECTFPEFLRSAKDEETGLLRPWKTGTHWFQISTNPQIQELSEIYVTGSDMWQFKLEFPRSCETKARRLSNKISRSERCGQRTLSYNRTCLTVDNAGLHTYRLLEHHREGWSGTKYVCVSFQRRGNNVVTIRKGPLRDRNVPELCNDVKMENDAWPWLATWEPSPYICPISGGFSLRVISGLTMKDTCENEWRNSSLEVECSKGEGIGFIPPTKSSCNPFSNTSHITPLYCWAGWQDGPYTYMIVSAKTESNYHNEPQFCLRFPTVFGTDFEAFLYVSVICPTDWDGRPPAGINYFKLKIRRKNNAICEDDNEEECSKLKDSGICEHSQNGFYEHCLKTCGECDNSAAVRKTCSFESKLNARWKLIDRDRFERVTINSSHVVFSEMGAFECYQTTPDVHQYTVTTAHNNGCSKRYSCIELERLGNNIIRYRIGPSVRENQPFETLCQFQDDAYPVMDTYRSSAKKTLIYDDEGFLLETYCGFEGQFKFNGTYGGQQCLGMISDKDPDTCNTVATLTLRSKDCLGITGVKQYQCLQYISDESSMDETYLITKSKDGEEEYNCWVKSMSPEYEYMFPQPIIFKMPTPQCGMFARVLVHHDRQSDAELYLKEKEKCVIKSQTRQSPVDPAPSTVPYRPGTNGGIHVAPQGSEEFHNMAPRNSVFLMAFFCIFGHFVNSLLTMQR